MVTERRLRAAPVSACAGYHAIGARVILRFTVMAVTAAARSGLTWSLVHAVVVGWLFIGVGFHATNKGVKLSCEIYCAISLWS